MIPMDLWNSEEMKRRRENAEAKALKAKPSVKFIAKGDHVNVAFYEVKDRYTVRLNQDRDGQVFIECDCLAGNPPIDENTGLPTREAVPCYHASAVLLHIAEIDQKWKEDGDYA